MGYIGRGPVKSGAFRIIDDVSSSFNGLNLLERHKLIYNALNDMIKQEIHALSMKTYTINEWQEIQGNSNG
mgnify:CR=1 FL=1